MALRQCSTAGTSAKPEAESPAGHQAGPVGQQATPTIGLADAAQTGSPPEEAVATAEAADTPVEEAAPTAGAADTYTENAGSTAEAADASAVSTLELAQPVRPQAETKDEALATPPTVDTVTADISQHRGEASVANASPADEDQKVVVAAAAATDAAAAATNAAAAANAAASDAAISTDCATSAAAASTSPAATPEEGAASQDSASAAAAVVMSGTDHTPVDMAPSGLQRTQPDQLSSRHAFAAAQYATGSACHKFGLAMTLVLMGNALVLHLVPLMLPK